MKHDGETDTAVDIALLKKDVADLKEESRKWNQLVSDIIKRIVALLLLSIGSGWLFGWHLSDPARKALIDWISK